MIAELEINLDLQLKKYWELLGHEGLGYTEIRCINKNTKSVASSYENNFENFLKTIKYFLNQSTDIFVGINPRNERSGKAKNVSYLCNFVIDLDEIKLNPLDYNDESLIINSGRGYHLYYSLEPIKIENNLEELTSISKQFTECKKETYEKYGKVDHCFDLSHVMRCPGTYNTKNNTICKFVDLDKKIKKFNITDFKFEKVLKKETLKLSDRFLKIENKLVIYNNYESPSEKIYHIVKQLINFGFSQDEINVFIENKKYGTPGKSYFDDIQRIFKKVEDSLKIKPINLFWDLYENSINRRELGFFTGIESLNNITGGFMRKELTILGARPSVGKTTFLINIIDEFLMRGIKVLMFPTEMNFTPLIDKLISMRSKIPLYKFRKNDLSLQDIDTIKTFYKEIKNSNFIVSEISSPNLFEIRQIVSQVNPDVTILDYFNRVSVKGEGDNRRISLEDFVRNLKTIAKDFNCSMIVASQLNRSGDSSVPSTTSLRDTDVLEQEADLLIMLGTEDKMQYPRLLHCTIGKNRHGELGYIPLIFDTKIGRIQEKK